MGVMRVAETFRDQYVERLADRIVVLDHGRVVGSGTPAELSAEAVQQFFGLTRKEAALALRLAAGRSLLEAARDQGISLNTARAHLRAIFAKTGIDRQSRLVGALLKSAARVAR